MFIKIIHLVLILCFSIFISCSTHCKSFTDSSSSSSSSLYLSPSVFTFNYQKMLMSFRIYIYKIPKPISFTSPVESLFVSSLQNSPFVTQNPEEAHLFFLPFSSYLSARSIARVVRELRMEFPYWNRTLGADHFYVSRDGLGYESDRNLVELKKNSIQISCFPTPDGKFVPHKDITLPPLHSTAPAHAPANRTARYRGFVKHNGVKDSALVNDLKNDSDFLIEAQPSDEKTLEDRLASTEFCLFEYKSDISAIGLALRFGCLPVVLTDRPMQDLPLMDVIRCQEIAVVMCSSGGLGEVKQMMERTCVYDTCNRMRKLGVVASQHFVWNESPEPYDAFHMIMYQLWMRRHTIRYARRELS